MTMAELKQNTDNRPEDVITEEKPAFKGYTLDELRYQRALVMLRREFAKQKVNHKLRTIRKTNAFTGTASGSKSSGLVRAGSIASRILSGMNYLDYAMIGISAFGTVRKIASFFGRKKKK